MQRNFRDTLNALSLDVIHQFAQWSVWVSARSALAIERPSSSRPATSIEITQPAFNRIGEVGLRLHLKQEVRIVGHRQCV